MFIGKLSVGLAAVGAAVAIAPAAQATIFHVGDVPHFYITSGTPTSESITANFGNGFNSAQSFDDSYLFTIPQNGAGSGSISTSFSSSSNKLTISSLEVNGTIYSVPSNGSGQSIALNDIPILAGVLNTIRVIGTTSRLGGTYSGTVTFSAGAVPEAATWGMMVLGFGAMGVSMRRRRTNVTFA